MTNHSKVNSVSRFIFINNIQPADVIIARRVTLGLLDHYVVYLGINRYGEHYFAANLGTSVGVFSASNLAQLTSTYGPVSVRKFAGSDIERREALDRAMEKFQKGEPYNLISSNCEHYANYVQTGNNYSQQSRNAYAAAAATGFGIALTSNNPLLQILGIAVATVGTVGAIEEESNRPVGNDKLLMESRRKLLR